MNAIEELCPKCGLCCNGVLFGDVELQRGDDAKRLVALGVALFTKERKKVFNQPCACLADGRCRVYAARPQRCRAFVCRQIQWVEVGETSVASAHQAIVMVRRYAAEVLRLVRALGNHDELMPLNRRYAVIMAEPIDFAGDDAVVEQRSELMLAVGRLVELLERNFLTGAPHKPKRPA